MRAFARQGLKIRKNGLNNYRGCARSCLACSVGNNVLSQRSKVACVSQELVENNSKPLPRLVPGYGNAENTARRTGRTRNFLHAQSASFHTRISRAAEALPVSQKVKQAPQHHRSQSQGSRLATLVCTRRDENNAAVTWNSLDQWHAVDEGGDRYPVIRNCLKLNASCGGTYVRNRRRRLQQNKCGRLVNARGVA